MRKLLLILFIMSFFRLSIKANDVVLQIDSFKNNWLYTIGVVPSSFMNTKFGFQITQEVVWKERLSFSLESGYLFDNLLNQQSQLNGLRLRPSVNVLFHGRHKNANQLGIFYNYRATWEYLKVEVSRANGAYVEEIRGDHRTIFNGPGISYHHLFFLEDYTIKFGMGMGIGVVNNKYDQPELEPFRNLLDIFPTSPRTDEIFPIFFFHFDVSF